MRRAEVPEGERIETDALRIGNSKTLLGKGWNGWNGAETVGHKKNEPDRFFFYRGGIRRIRFWHCLAAAPEPVARAGGCGADVFSDDDDPPWTMSSALCQLQRHCLSALIAET